MCGHSNVAVSPCSNLVRVNLTDASVSSAIESGRHDANAGKEVTKGMMLATRNSARKITRVCSSMGMGRPTFRMSRGSYMLEVRYGEYRHHRTRITIRANDTRYGFIDR